MIGIAAAAMGTVAMAAAAHQWSRGMLNHLQGTTEQMQQLEEKEMASFPELSVTDEGVTVSVQQCIVNGAWGIVDLKVSGYDLPEGKEPNFQTADLEVKDWGGSWSISGQFDDGLLTDGYRVIGKDGQGIETEEDGSLVQYWQDENGDLWNTSSGSLSMMARRTNFLLWPGRRLHLTWKDSDMIAASAK